MRISTLPDEILANVLSRLPVKSLMRFRCVCKSWRPLMSNPQFIKLHLNRAIQDVNGSCKRALVSSFPLQSVDYEAHNYDVDNACVVLDFLTRVGEYFIEIAGSCNGLVCLVVDDENIIVCNPSTRVFKELPKPSTLSDGSFAYGFGYDPSVDDYKVVRVTRPTSSDNSADTQVEIFSLRSTSWRKVQYIHPSITLDGSGTFSGGALHWLQTGETGQVIVSFELATEEFKEVVQVSVMDQGDNNLSNDNLDVSGECISLTCRWGGPDGEDLCVLKKYGMRASLTKLFTIPVVGYIPHYEYWMKPVCFSKNGEVLIDFDGRELLMYNPEKRSFRNLAIQEPWDFFEVAQYVESLVSPNGNGEDV